MDKEKEQRIKGKLNYFLESGLKVHVKRIDKQYWRGYVIGKASDDIYNFADDKLGNMLLFVLDVYDVVEFKEVSK